MDSSLLTSLTETSVSSNRLEIFYLNATVNSSIPQQLASQIPSLSPTTPPPNPMFDRVINNKLTAAPFGKKDKGYCDRPWPKLELLIPMGFSKINPTRNFDWKETFLPSFLLFWPIERSKTSIVFLTDYELKDTPILKEYLLDDIDKIRNDFMNNEQGKKQFPQINIKYHEHPVSEAWNHTTNKVNYALLPYSSGYDRQQYMGFIADLHSDADYIGLADRDTMFHSFVDREDIFVDGKPVVHGLLLRILYKWKSIRNWPKSVYSILGLEMPMICMSYFPVTIKRSHFKDMRDYMIQHHKLSTFDEVYQRIFKNVDYYSQFCVMCAYLFWKKRDEYSWFVHDNELWWNGNEPKPIWGQYGDKSIYTEQMKELRSYIALHARYRFHRLPVIDHENATFNRHAIYAQSVCSHPTPPIEYPNMNCSVYKENFSYFDEQFAFEHGQFDEVWGCGPHVAKAAFDKRMERFDGCDLSYANFSFRYIFDSSHYNKTDFNELLSLKLKFREHDFE